MNCLFKKAALFSLCLGLIGGMTSCKDDDPDYENVTPPVVEEIAPTLQGVITTNNGAALSGATITLSGAGSFTATTDSEGKYAIADLKAGTYTVEAKAANVTTATGSVTVAAGESAVWNALLPKVVTEVAAKITDTAVENKQQVTVPSVAGSTSDAPKIDVTVPANSLSKPVELSLAFNNSTSTTGSRASKSLALLNMTLTSSDPSVVFNSPISFSVPVSVKPSSVTLDGKAIEFTYANGICTMQITGLGNIIVAATITTSESTKSQSISFSPSQWDNLYGSSEMTATSSSYSFQMGGSISGSNGLLNNILALDTQVASAKTVNATYEPNVVLPIGTMMAISGSQRVKTVTYTLGSATATATIYGNVTINVATANRQHTGGSN